MVLLLEKSYRIQTFGTDYVLKSYDLEEFANFMIPWCRSVVGESVDYADLYKILLNDGNTYRNELLYKVYEIWNSGMEKIAILNLPYYRLAIDPHDASSLYLYSDKIMEYVHGLLHDYEREQLEIGIDHWLDSAIFEGGRRCL